MKTLDTEEIETQATSCEDGKTMRFTSSLLVYLTKPGRPHKFHISDWLQALDGETLYHLRELARMTMDNPESMGAAMSDILAVVVNAVSAERQTLKMTFSLDQLGQHIEMLHHAAALERLRRKGLLSYESISIDPEEKNVVFFPDEASSLADEVRREFMPRMH